MRRILVNGAKVAIAGLMLGVAGCGGGGIEEGVPKDLTPGVDINTLKMQPTKGVPGGPPAKDGNLPAPKKTDETPKTSG